MAGSRFIIRRKDRVTDVDDLVIDTEGLTIGRLVGNDLVLNHPAVSRTHGGIKQLGSDYWLFNLSRSNGTLLNGELVERAPLAEGDAIQIGPFLLGISYAGTALSIGVEMGLDVQPVEGRAVETGSQGEQAGTMLVKIVAQPGKQSLTPGGTRRLEGTGLLTSFLPALDQQALEVFWEKRKREAGKVAPVTPLQPSGPARLGKSRFNWRPTLDLKLLRRKSVFAWAALIVVPISVAAAYLYSDAYSPGQLSDTHAATTISPRNIAQRPNASSCNDCHSPATSVDGNCSSCHTTEASASAPAFQPSIYDAHSREGLRCTTCHSEHKGQGTNLGLVRYGICANCHNGSYAIRTGDRAGLILEIPHGGTTGYPVVDRSWQWKGLSAQRWKAKGLPESLANQPPKEQFHLLHQKGRLQGRVRCSDCHTAGVRGDEAWRVSPRSSCAACHGLAANDAGFMRIKSNCYTCHQQHGRSEDIARLVPAAGKDPTKIKDYLAALAAGLDSEDTGPGVQSAGFGAATSGLRSYGGLPWYVWALVAAAAPVAGLSLLVVGSSRQKSALAAEMVAAKTAPPPLEPGRSIDLEKLKEEGPPYPHPVIDPLLCIGCHACVEACPHDVIAIVNGVANPVAPDQCMEDTGCQVECPTSPKACIVINTTKPIPSRKVPSRNQRLMTNVEGVYMVGDVSGVPLIKNAINEGGQVIDLVMEDLTREGSGSSAQYDVAVIGVGPAGLSAAVIAKQRGLRYLAIEQDKVVATIQGYPAGKYVFFKPDTVQPKGGIPLPGPGDKKETMIESWIATMRNSGVVVNEEESCKDIKRQNGAFLITTEKDKLKEQASYTARRVILAIGNRGTPMRLGVPGEDMKILVQAPPAAPKFCPKCGTPPRGSQGFCAHCGEVLPKRAGQPREETKVKYKLSDPDDYVHKKCMVVGAGNSAVEAAVDLCGLQRSGDQIRFTRDNEVTLVVRSDFKGDLKLGNKINVYDCIDAGRIKVYYRTELKEIREKEVALMDGRSKKETARIPNDFVFALIGGERPTKFLEKIGIKIG